ncbi:hypothetical protein DD829_15505 [Chryseobacterium sp. HMWF035]|nr:hypothetical protein DBR25_10330 [Chryseobacterium sp. HMWF001]PVV55183.1 hypothetical protein DD829_15505 [Chryseobacterium sp. HMWF035]
MLRHVNYVLYYCRTQISSYKLSNHNGEFMDLVQEGISGLLIAAHRYNPDKAAFLTYARYYIKVVIDNYLATIGNKSPFNTKDQVGAAVQAYHLLNSTQNETGEILQLEEVAQLLGVSSRVLLQKIEAQAFNVISLDAPIRKGDEESTR